MSTVKGSCHCKAVRYEAEVDLAQGTTRCNCTWCTKTGWWGVMVKPAAFRLLSDPSATARVGSVGRETCPKCGIAVFGQGDLPELGGAFVSLNVRCWDDVDLTGVLVHHLDGLHDTWAHLGSSPIPPLHAH
jgi:hypothetical protein